MTLLALNWMNTGGLFAGIKVAGIWSTTLTSI